MGKAADFFISYTSDDRAWAEWIAWQLEAEGYQVVVQAWDFIPGRSWTHEMQQATATAERVVAVLSAAYLESEHGEAEWEVFQAKDPLGKRGLLVPVRVAEVDPPGLLKTRVYVDLVGRDAASAHAALLAAARGARGKPTEEPEFPGAQQPRGSISEAPRFPGELPPVWNVPFHPNPFFTGRDDLLAKLEARLHANDGGVRRVVLVGLGGVGKTQLAVEYAYQRRADFELVWWIRGEQLPNLLGEYAALAFQSPLAADLGLEQEAPKEVVVSAVRNWLEHHQRWLLVFDNLEDPQTAADLLPRSATGQVLITSRSEIGWEQLASPLVTEVLTPTAAKEFLLNRTGETDAEAHATKLAMKLGGLPLALEQAGAYIVATGIVTLEGYTELFQTRAMELLRRGQPIGYEHTVATTWSLALETLEKTHAAAVGLLNLAAFLAPDDLPVSLLTAHSDVLPEPLRTVAADPLFLGDTVAALRRYSLVRVIGDGLFTHQLVQTVVRAALDSDVERNFAVAALQLIFAAFPDSSDDVATWAQFERLLPHGLAVTDHGERLRIKSEQWIWLLDHLSSYLWRQGQYQQGRMLSERAMANLVGTFGFNHPHTLSVINNSAVIRHAQGDLRGAQLLQVQSLVGRLRVLGEDHPDTLTSMSNLASIRRGLGDLQGAITLHEQALAGRRRVLGEDHPDTLGSIANLAAARHALGDLQGALELQEQALALYERVLGEDHSETITAMNNLAVMRHTLADIQGAHDLQVQILAARQRTLGNDHPDTLTAMNNLAESRRELGNLRGARDLQEQALASSRQSLGDDHPITLTSMNNLALVLQDLGDLNGAFELHRQVLAGSRRVLGDDHPSTLSSVNNLATIVARLGDLYVARGLYEQALAGFRRVLGDDHPQTLSTMRSLLVLNQRLSEL